MENTFSRSSYSKLTVPQLKARCKKLNITGYSKLGKAALLEKLAQYESSRNAINGATPKAADTPSVALPGPQPQIVALVAPSVSSKAVTEADRQKGDVRSLIPTENGHSTTIAPPATDPSNQAYMGQKIEKPKPTKKRINDSARGTSSPTPKRQKVLDKGYTKNGAENVPPVKWTVGKASKITTFSRSAQITSSTRQVLATADPVSDCNTLPPRQPSGVPTSKRFRPLLLCQKECSKPAQRPSDTHSPEQLFYLDFCSAPTSPPPTCFSSITIPPTLWQRKRINAWSVILSGLSVDERRKCALVSRAIRYAVYLSAVPIITRVFGPRRLAGLPQKYNTSMTNFWPYLKQLRAGLADNRKVYATSFIARFFGNHMPILEQIWGCPENDKQLTVALRFLMTRIWFAISINGAHGNRAKKSIVTEVREIVKGEIWKITVTTKPSRNAKMEQEMFYVLEPTCEVIGRPPAPVSQPSAAESSGRSETANGTELRLRVDWSDYVKYRMSVIDGCDSQPSLLNNLKSTNGEEYTNGISKLWLTRTSREGEAGKYKRTIAERYVLASVVGNSVSGRWMSSTHMAQVFAGTASEPDSEMIGSATLHKRMKQRVNLFLPEHHLVESVHFSTSGPKGQNLHPALAIIQTPGREYFILRNNGLEVGCEEDGVWPVWMELLGCDARGVACP